MLVLYVEAPFAVFRTFTAGWYRPTATFLTPSAAYGLLLNVARDESRLREEEDGHDGKTLATLTRQDLPKARIALGVPRGQAQDFPRVQTIYQQLHNYLAGGNEKVRDPDAPGQKITKEALGLRRTKSNKYNITPVRREILCGLRALIALDGNDELEDRIGQGLRGESNDARYGLPFLGDNQFLLDRLQIIEPDRLPETRWYEMLGEDVAGRPREHTARLTVSIDRADMSKTRSALYAPTETATREPPPSAWTDICPPTSTVSQ